MVLSPLLETDSGLEKHDHIFKQLCLRALGRQTDQLRPLLSLPGLQFFVPVGLQLNVMSQKIFLYIEATYM